MFSLRLFGGASLESDGVVLSGSVAQRHRLALLSLLSCSYPRSLSRDKLIGFLWPERDAERARNLLNQSVHALRKTLGDDVVLSVGDELVLGSPPLTCDILAFEDALASGDRERAIALHTGPFLDGFFLRNAPEFELWLSRERDRLRFAWRDALRVLAEEKLAGGHADAAKYWRRLLADDPHDARVTCGLMEALASVGDRAGALRQARLHDILLDQDLGAGPDPAVRALAHRLRSGRPRDDTVSTGTNQSVRPPAAPTTTPLDTPPGVVPGDRAAGAMRRGPSRSRRKMLRLAAGTLLMGSLAWFSMRSLPSQRPAVTHIAVLPLVNLSGDPQQEYFAAGLHDALISELARIKSLTVFSRQSVLRYEGSQLPLPAVARQLGADAVVEGTVFRSGDSIRISLQLVRARPEEHLLSMSFTAAVEKALAVQARVAGALADAMRARITPTVRGRLTRNRSVVPAAQDAYLAGVYHLEHAAFSEVIPASQRAAEYRQAIARLEEAVALDSTWARAYAKLAQAEHFRASRADDARNNSDEAHEYYRKAKAAALRALELDSTEAQAYASLGFVLFHIGDAREAERAIRRAIDLDPNSYHWIYALFLMQAGRQDEAIAQYQMALARDPLSDLLKAQAVVAYACADRPEEAIAQARELHARVAATGRRGVEGDTLWLLNVLAEEYSFEGAYARALDAARSLVALTDTLTSGHVLAFALAMAGRRSEAESLVVRLAANGSGQFAWAFDVYAALGESDRAVAALRDVINNIDLSVARPALQCWAGYKLLYADPRVQEIARSLHVTPRSSPQ